MPTDPTPTHALVRPPGRSFAAAISSSPISIDVPLAQAQHAEYCQALAAAGLDVTVLPADESFPDGCFTQDPAVVIDDLAVIGRLAAPSRSGEEESIAAWLSARRRSIARIDPPGTLEGGDVMRLPGRLLVGLSGRTNAAALDQLRRLLARTEDTVEVEGVPVDGVLHLLTAATYAGRGVLVAADPYADHPAFRGLDIIRVSAAERYAANTLGIGDHVILPAGYPAVTAALRARGFTPLPVPMTEFAKADGGVTCLSLLW